MDDCEDISQLVANNCLSRPTNGTIQPNITTMNAPIDELASYVHVQPPVNHQENLVNNHQENLSNHLDHDSIAVENPKVHDQVMHQLPAPQNEGGDRHVLRVVVENLLYPITLDVLYTIFTKFGKVMKAITFHKNNQFQALIQMENSTNSQTAKLCLDGQNIYNECCTLRIDYSKLPHLNVKYNNDKSRDYTRDDLPSGEANNAMVQLNNGLNPYYLSNVQSAGLSQNVNSMTNFQQSQLGMMQHKANGQLSNPNVTFQLATLVGNQRSNSCTVLHVSNLNEDLVTPNVLFTLFGVYGDVVRVKILFQKKSSALVQMHDDTQACLVKKHLHGVKLFGQAMHIVNSRHSQVQMPREGQDVENLTRDYANSSLHRFKKPGSKNYSNIFPPSEVLHLSNIPQEITETFIREAFSQHCAVKGFKFFAKDRRMALIQLHSVESAVTGLVNLHNFKLTDTYHLRVSFSKGHL